MSARKTVKVTDLIDRANWMLANSDDSYEQQREGIRTLLESVLFSAGAYQGFQFLPGDDGSRRKYYGGAL